MHVNHCTDGGEILLNLEDNGKADTEKGKREEEQGEKTWKQQEQEEENFLDETERECERKKHDGVEIDTGSEHQKR